ncbi:hypothetical protein PGLA_07395 [Paenibacillus glacialis]|uniref:Adenosine deaminase domain-containing protein n=2 Tax=Paenibacillus glacialis TaxID=494026 RepID=A0A168MBH7_9BACL|nr:hypothetical protein PGLA_07395 [Paenibacillus glacialis]
MQDKIFLMLNVALFPFKDLNFYGQELVRQVAEEVNTFEPGKKASRSQKNNEQLLSRFHNDILLKCKPNSLDEVNLIMEKFYPFLWKKSDGLANVDKSIYIHYFCILEEFTKALLSHRDGEIVFKYWKNERENGQNKRYNDFWDEYKELDKVHIFNAISRLIPMDLLVAMHYSINHITEPIQLNGFYQHVNLADAPLHDVLQRGVAENHIHASAAFNFTTLWSKAMNEQNIEKQYRKFKVSHYATSRQITEYLLTAQIMRLIMALYLSENSSFPILRWLTETIKDPEILDILIGKVLHYDNNVFLEASQLKEIIEDLKKNYGLTDGDRKHDIMFSIFRNHEHIKTYGENIFLQRIFKYKGESEHAENNHFEQFFHIFLKYVAIKNEFYQQVTQSNSIKGLDFFKPYFDRATHFVEKSDYLTLLRTLFQNQYLKKVELRLSILDNEGKNKGNIKNILAAYRTILEEDYRIGGENPNANFPRIGIIYHLIKQPDDIEKNWAEFNENKENTEFNLHYGKVQKKYLASIQMMLNLRNSIPYLANFIVGIDAASLENNTPVQVFAPVFGSARNSDDDGMIMTDREGLLVKNQSLFFTFHAGEDFRHLNSGLRRIDEVIDYCKFHSGDRIGHGIALGVHIEEWVRRNKVVIIPRGEYLDNLLWIWDVYSRTSNFSSKTYVYLEQKIYSVANTIFTHSAGLTVPLLHEVYKNRFKKIGSVSNEVRSGHREGYAELWDCEGLMRAYHTKSYLEKMMEPIYVNTADIEQEMTSDMQKYLIQKVAMTGVVVEINPSSNYAIGEIGSVFDNQFFNIQSPSNSDLSNIIININSDDPIVFNTNVSNEIAYLYYGMLDRGLGKDAALTWIENLRKSGMDTSFIRGNISNGDYILALDCLLAALDDPTYCK